ncbi:hypothetical protein H9L16_11375 [Thermomonas carbonis]|uniref:Glycosyltransferase n=1 Tax=Thermomonas carbonis TaxID=1463158 RepID=A0A7G9SN47_9GAMM|nr:glycosyltransferase [Thermomonas carbonis]QNN69272.1 hypothetical protein H9L16_11375 [Thermomonas carbonis]
MRVAMVTTHPIQYQVPWLRLLSNTPGIELHVYFSMLPDAAEQGREFGVSFDWDIPLLEGYAWSVLENRSRHPSLTTFGGCDTPGIGRELRKGNYDAVIVNGWGFKTCLQALLACRIAGIPCIVRGEANGLRPRAWWKRWLHACLLSQYAACLAIGTNNRRYLLDAGVPASRIFATPYCVENERFAIAADAARSQIGREALQFRFGLDPERATFLFSGKFVDKKRPGDIIEAIRGLDSNERERIQLLLVGAGHWKPNCVNRQRTCPCISPDSSINRRSRRPMPRLIAWSCRQTMARLGAWWSTRPWPAVCQPSSAIRSVAQWT